ncbi:LytTR family DNA-binding domain-containing protein [Dyadobacter sp. CY356]|uniref:LytR/AlgR family response regulator transcription factor n=1 Tax=Dyadobacter sp. CY356 TaxID=2906442 RepID=UPI001F1B75DF|nr:LytTR family DNA-binding domain-containing protein [Dyadobacter sp. CY356]MCF0054776.1 LytTR family DNA-binding domain-containing protein [Dyadobacter sp. CY356]
MLRCLIIDDEPMAQELIEKYIKKIPFLESLGCCGDGLEGLFKVRKLKPDLIFLDIDMPELNGLDFLKMLPQQRPSVIMITADPSYALEGFEQQVSDYLLKPVSFERFMRAVSKADAESNRKSEVQTISRNIPAKKDGLAGQPHQKSIDLDFIFVREDGKQIRLDLSDILYVEGMKDYLKIHRLKQISVVHVTMTRIEEVLPETSFIRVNRSFIVNISYINMIEGHGVTLKNGTFIPVGVTYRDRIKMAFQKNWI